MTKSKKIILLTTGLILTICLMAFFGVYALTIAKNSTFNVGVKYEPEYLVKVEMWIDGANGGTEDKIIDDKEYVEIFNSSTPVSNGMYIQSMSNDTIHINSQTLTPIGVNGDVYFKITSLENATSGNKDLQCIINCGSSTADSGKLVIDTPKILTIATGINATSGTPTSSSLGMIKINLKFSEFLLDLKYLVGNDETGIDFGEAGKIETNVISGTTFYVSNIDGLLNLSALVGQINTTTTEYGLDYGYDNSAGPARTFSGAIIQMLNDIDCENGDNKDSFSKTFIPIGYYNFGDIENSFQGTFDGNNKSINGLYVNATEEIRLSGLFGYALNAEIKNLKMINCKIIAEMAGGSIVAHAPGSMNINNCSSENTYISGTVESSILGGIAGRVYNLNIEDCYNTGNIIGGGWVGGIVGNVYETTITNCYNTGSVSGGYVGGIMGYVEGTVTITNCYNTGSVSGSSCVGGIVGYGGGTISDCYNEGMLSGGSIGGIVGSVCITTIITKCYNTFSIIDSEYCAGGIVGEVYEITTITDCYNEGSINGSDNVGGIVGDCESSSTVAITNCYNTGSVSGTSNNVGGIVGLVYDAVATITNCYNTGSVSGTGSYVGGIVGHYNGHGTTITNCYNTGSVGGDNYIGGIVGSVVGTSTITNCYYLKIKTSSVNASLNAIGRYLIGALNTSSYYGTFSSAGSELTECDDSPNELAYGTTDLLTVLNAYVSEHSTYTDETSGLEIKLTTWEIRTGENDGYPVFVITETVA